MTFVHNIKRNTITVEPSRQPCGVSTRQHKRPEHTTGLLQYGVRNVSVSWKSLKSFSRKSKCEAVLPPWCITL